jgi:ABC-type transport system involved in multi-copper enzyme maturation permease subunit
MGKVNQILSKKVSLMIIIGAIILSCCFLHPIISIQKSSKPNLRGDPILPHPSITYGTGVNFIENQTITEDIIITSYAILNLINTTIQGSIYVFNMGTLNVLENSTIKINVVASDFSNLLISNSTIGGTIECRDNSVNHLSESATFTTTIWKFDFANLTIYNSSFNQLNEFGISGIIQIINSHITLVNLNGISSSLTYITNSEIGLLNDNASPLTVITGPYRFNFLAFNASYKTSERIINVSWIGWDSPIIDGYLNITFQLFVDDQLYAEVNGSGLEDQFIGNYELLFSDTGYHNISIISIDGAGNRYTSSIIIEIINYPTFQWIPFLISIAIIFALIFGMIYILKHRERKGYFSSIIPIFQEELAESKIKILIFTLIAAAPGILLYIIFKFIEQLRGTISIDTVRDMISLSYTLFLNYYGLGFSISFAAGAIINAKRDGSLSWFFSKPLRRWEYLWGKILAYLLIVIITSISTSISIIIGCSLIVNPIYIIDIFSLGGFIFIISISALTVLTALVVLCSSVFKKVGLAYLIPIMFLMVAPTLISFLPVIVRSDWPLLFSFTYYYEQLATSWISSSGGFFGSLGNIGELFGISITHLNLTPIPIILIISGISIACFVLATTMFQKQDLP